MKRTTTLILLVLCGLLTGLGAQAATLADSTRTRKLDRGIKKMTFINKGQWFMGATASYMSMSADDFKFLVVNDMKANAYSFSGKILAGYCIADDIGVGLSFDYSRGMIDIPKADISLGDDINLGIDQFYSIQQVYTGTAFLRTYINLGESRRFGLFNDLRLSLGGGQGKITNGLGEVQSGTYQNIFTAGLLIQPGVTVFITDYFAVETSIGLLGLKYNRTEQITNQVHKGYVETWDANFKVNLFSINLGLSFYF